jgi:hypothetical protein
MPVLDPVQFSGSSLVQWTHHPIFIGRLRQSGRPFIFPAVPPVRDKEMR